MTVSQHPICLAQDLNFNTQNSQLNYQQLMLLDVLTNLAFHQVNNDNGYEINFNEYLYTDKIPKVITNFNKQEKPITLKFTDTYLRSKLPFISKITKLKLFELIVELSDEWITMKYPTCVYNEESKKIEKDYNSNIQEGYLFTLNDFTKKGKHKHYTITFDTQLGLKLINNVLGINRSIVVGKFYDLSANAQLFYRYFILPFQANKKKDISIKDIRKRMEFKSDDYDLVRKIISPIFESLKEKGFIDKWRFDQITCNFKYVHTSLKFQKELYISEQLAGSVL